MSILDDLTVTLPDIAELAHVQRPVVSMWRRRYADAATPFPQPVAVRAGSPRFRASEVAAWVRATGLGNNDRFAADLARRAVLTAPGTSESPGPLGVTPRVAFDGLTALLCVSTVAEERLPALSRAELLDLADEADPDDAFLYSELDALGPALGRFAEHAELVGAAAFSAADAVEQAVADRARLGAPDLQAGALARPVLDLVGALASALLRSLPSGGVLGDPHPGCGDVVVGVLRAWERGEAGDTPPVVLGRAADGMLAARLARRRLSARHVPWQEHAGDEFELRGPGVVVSQLPPPAAGAEDATDVRVLTALDDVALGLAPGQRAVVVGPASALCDALREPEAERTRAALLRTDRVRSVVRLPAGLVPSRSRQHLALWVLGDAHPKVPIGERWTTVADLSAVRPGVDGFAPDVVQDLVSDVLAAQGSRAHVWAHAFRYARFARTRELLANAGDLVAGVRPLARGVRDDDGATAARLHTLLREGMPELPVVQAEVAASSGVPVRTSRLGDLADAGRLHVVPGNRLDPAHVGPAGDVPVIGVPELLGDAARGSRRMDRLTFAGAYDAGRYTEPGDIVFTTTPYPAAVVDVEGVCVVEFPARVIRPAADAASAGLVSRLVAADVTAQPGTAKRWRSWEVRLVAPGDAGALAALLDDVAARRAALAAELARLDEVERLASSGVVGGSVRLAVHNATGEPTGAEQK